MRLFAIQNRKECEMLADAVVVFSHTHIPTSDRTHYVFSILLPIFTYEAYKDVETRAWYRGWLVLRFGISFYRHLEIRVWEHKIGNRVLLFTQEQAEDRGYV